MLTEFLFSFVTLESDLYLRKEARDGLKKIRVRRWLSRLKGLHCKPDDLCFWSGTHKKQDVVSSISNPRIPKVRWESGTGQSAGCLRASYPGVKRSAVTGETQTQQGTRKELSPKSIKKYALTSSSIHTTKRWMFPGPLPGAPAVPANKSVEFAVEGWFLTGLFQKTHGFLLRRNRKQTRLKPP